MEKMGMVYRETVYGMLIFSWRNGENYNLNN